MLANVTPNGARKPPDIFLRSWSEEKEFSLIHELSLCLGKQGVDMNKLASIMRSKDHYGNDQLSGQQVGVSLRVMGITLDRGIMTRWMKAADIIGKGIYSIPVLIDIMEKADKKAKGGGISEAETKKESSITVDDPPADSDDDLDSDSRWKNLLDLNSSLPKQKGRSTTVDMHMKQKNVARLKAAMYQSYHQYQGYLPPKDVVQLSLAYSTVFYLGMDQGGIRGAIDCAMDHSGRLGMVNIDKFIQAILDYIM